MASALTFFDDTKDGQQWIPLQFAAICSPRRKMNPNRRRTAQACDRCKLKKTKCNGLSPCGTCTQSNYHCHYTVRKKRSEGNKRDMYQTANQELYQPYNRCKQACCSPKTSLQNIPSSACSCPASEGLQTQVMLGDVKAIIQSSPVVSAHVAELNRSSLVSHGSSIAANSTAPLCQADAEITPVENIHFHHHAMPRHAASGTSTVGVQDLADIGAPPSKTATSTSPTMTASLSDESGSPPEWSPEGCVFSRRDDQMPALLANSRVAAQIGFQSPAAKSKNDRAGIRAHQAGDDPSLVDECMQDERSMSISTSAARESACLHQHFTSVAHHAWPEPTEQNGNGLPAAPPAGSKLGPTLIHGFCQPTHDQQARFHELIYHQDQWYNANWALLQFQNQCFWGSSNAIHNYDTAGFPPSHLVGGVNEQQFPPSRSEVWPFNAWQWH